ncbi:MAG: deaminase, partial [Rhodospirillales bacterium]
GYHVQIIKLSKLIEECYPPEDLPKVQEGPNEGQSKLERAVKLQDLGDTLRRKYGAHAISSLVVRKIRDARSGKEIGEEKLAFILDSIKHEEEVSLLRHVYDNSFRLIAVHCERSRRESRLIGSRASSAKYRGAEKDSVLLYLDRDEKDANKKFGQQVRNAFYLGDYFLNNNVPTTDGLRLAHDVSRFTDLVLDRKLVRPTAQESGMFAASAAALQSSCLSRQVGAALQTPDGRIVSVGTNEVPKFGGGTYVEGSIPDHRCFKWETEVPDDDGKQVSFTGCHNARLKRNLRLKISSWLAKKFAAPLSDAIYPKKDGEIEFAIKERNKAKEIIEDRFLRSFADFDDMPGVGDLIEYSRAIHAEMNAVISAARQGVSPEGTTLYTTTFPCHNCARHLVTAGVYFVYYIEPFVKSLAQVLHHDSIKTELPDKATGAEPVVQTHMYVVPFTGVGPRMYEYYFRKMSNLKNDTTGLFIPPDGSEVKFGVRLRMLENVEEAAIDLVKLDA